MKRRILLLDVTEMSGANVCVAGIDEATCEQLRLADPTPTRVQLRRWAELTPGDVISVECTPLRRPVPPHIEDLRWDPGSLRKEEARALDKLLEVADRCALQSVAEAFGAPWFRSRQGNVAWQPHRGERSLAFVKVRYVRSSVNAQGQLRLAFRDASDAYYHSVPLQDLRVKSHRGRCDSCERDLLRIAKGEFDANASVIRVGLTRPFEQRDHETACWLQVTNVFARPFEHFTTVLA